MRRGVVYSYYEKEPSSEYFVAGNVSHYTYVDSGRDLFLIVCIPLSTVTQGWLCVLEE